MKIASFVLALISLCVALAVAFYSHSLDAKIEQMAAAQGTSSKSASEAVEAKISQLAKASEEKAKTAEEKLESLKQSGDKNSAAIEDINRRINRLIDLVK